MAKNSAADEADAATTSRYGPRRIHCSAIETGSVKKTWIKVYEEYELEGYTEEEKAGIEVEDLRNLVGVKMSVEKLPAKLGEIARPSLSLADLTAADLWQVVRPERSVAIRAAALAELVSYERERANLALFVVEQLARDDLKPTWRNTLILATEHLDFLNAGQRQRLRDRLRSLTLTLNEEWHPRSRLAQEAAVRRYGCLIDDKAQLLEIVDFLSTAYPLRVRLIALQTIQNAFALAPPCVSMKRDLEPLRDELRRMVEFFFRGETLKRSEEDFDLGLTALEALIRLDDGMISEFVPRVKAIGRRWVARQLAHFLAETQKAWQASQSVSTAESVSAVGEVLDLLQSIEVPADR